MSGWNFRPLVLRACTMFTVSKQRNERASDRRLDKRRLRSLFVISRSMDSAYFPRIHVERTLALIKPDAIHKSEEIEDIILRNGFSILQKRKLQMTPEHCSDFYAEHYGKLHFPSLTAYMSSGPIVALTLARENAIAQWKSIIGPTKVTKSQTKWLRAKYGTSELQNALHGSESFHAAAREIKFMFPNTFMEAFPTRAETEEYLNRYVNETLLHGLTELCKHKPLNPCVWLADWLIKNNPNGPQICDGAFVKEVK